MQVKAMYENGLIRFAKPVQFKHRKFEVIMNIPDEEMDAQPVSNALDILIAQSPADPWLQQMKVILTDLQLTPDHEITELSQKQLDRSEAFSYREDR